MDAVIAERFLGIPRAELIARLDSAGIAYGSINDIEGLSNHPALRRVALAGMSDIEMVASPVRRASDDGALYGRPVPAIGQHSAAIRAEFKPGRKTSGSID